MVGYGKQVFAMVCRGKKSDIADDETCDQLDCAHSRLIMVFAISFVADKVLYATSMLVSIYDFINVPLLNAILSNDGSRLGKFMIREEEGVIGDVSFE